MAYIIITFDDRCRKIAKPVSYRDLIAKARKEFPMISSVACLVVMFYPKTTEETIPSTKMIELDSNAYGSVKDGEVLFFNVQHPITKEYILPYPDEDPKIPRQSQYRLADVECMFARSGPQQNDKVSCKQFRDFSCVDKHSNTFEPEVQRTGGDAFGSGWGSASDRFWRSTKLVPNLKECRDAVDFSVEDSHRHPDDQSANDWNVDVEPQRAFKVARSPTDAISGRRSGDAWAPLHTYSRFVETMETASAGGAVWGKHSNVGTTTDAWGRESASGSHNIGPLSPSTVDVDPDSATSGEELEDGINNVVGTADYQPQGVEEVPQSSGYDNPLQPPLTPNRLDTARNAPSTDHEMQRVQPAQQTVYLGPNLEDADIGPARAFDRPVAVHTYNSQNSDLRKGFYKTDPAEEMPQYKYGQLHEEYFPQSTAPATVRKTDLIPFESKEKESEYREAQHRSRTKRNPEPASEYHSSCFNPAKSTRGSPKKKQCRAQRSASSQWATRGVWRKAVKDDLQNLRGAVQSQRQALLDNAHHLHGHRNFSTDYQISHKSSSHKFEENHGPRPSFRGDVCYADNQVATRHFIDDKGSFTTKDEKPDDNCCHQSREKCGRDMASGEQLEKRADIRKAHLASSKNQYLRNSTPVSSPIELGSN